MEVMVSSYLCLYLEWIVYTGPPRGGGGQSGQFAPGLGAKGAS